MYQFTHPRKKKRLLTFVCASIILISLASSCKKGDPGTANVIFSDWFTASPWVKDTVFNLYGFSYTQSAPDITTQLMDSGTVIVYGKLLGYNPTIWPADQIGQLPIIVSYKFSVAGSTYTDTWSATISNGKVKIRFVNDQNYYTSIATSHQFRYIVIPGAKKATTSTARGIVTASGKVLDADALQDLTNNYKHMTYEEVCDKLGVPR